MFARPIAHAQYRDTMKLHGKRLRNSNRARETIVTQPINKMATSRKTEMTEAVVQALRDLAFSSGDQESLSELLTDYFSSDDQEEDHGKP